MLLALHYAPGALYAHVVLGDGSDDGQRGDALLTLMLGLWLLVVGKQRKHGLAWPQPAWHGAAWRSLSSCHNMRPSNLVSISRFISYVMRRSAIPLAPLFEQFLTQPGLVWQTVSTPDRVSYLVGLFASGGLILPLLAPELLLLGLPILAATCSAATTPCIPTPIITRRRWCRFSWRPRPSAWRA